MPTLDVQGNLHDRTGQFTGKQRTDAPAGVLDRAKPAWRSETLAVRRGHDFYPDNISEWPALYTTEGVPLRDKTIVAKYFGPAGDWWITEIDQKTGEAFGYAQLAGMADMAEWGYIDLPELEQLTVPVQVDIAGQRGSIRMVGVERDLDFEPVKASETIPEYRA